MGNLIKSIVISTLGLFTIAFISTSCNKETVEQLKVKKASRIYIGDGTPLLDKGEAGDYYIDKLTGLLYGPKSEEILSSSLMTSSYLVILLYLVKVLPQLTKEK